MQSRWRPYRVECTGSLSTSEVKRHRAWLVLGWGTAWEDLRVLPAFLKPIVWALSHPILLINCALVLDCLLRAASAQRAAAVLSSNLEMRPVALRKT